MVLEVRNPESTACAERGLCAASAPNKRVRGEQVEVKGETPWTAPLRNPWDPSLAQERLDSPRKATIPLITHLLLKVGPYAVVSRAIK